MLSNISETFNRSAQSFIERDFLVLVKLNFTVKVIVMVLILEQDLRS